MLKLHTYFSSSVPITTFINSLSVYLYSHQVHHLPEPPLVNAISSLFNDTSFTLIVALQIMQ